MQANETLCKVCEAPVARRKLFQPKACEACQKFFQRVRHRQKELNCLKKSPSDGTCSSNFKEPRCPRCRFAKCIQVGMKGFSKNRTLEKRQNIDQSSSSPSSQDGESVALVTSTAYQPKNYHNLVVEDTLRQVIKSFPKLHSVENVQLLCNGQLLLPTNSGDPFEDAVSPIVVHFGSIFAGTSAFARDLLESIFGTQLDESVKVSIIRFFTCSGGLLYTKNIDPKTSGVALQHLQNFSSQYPETSDIFTKMAQLNKSVGDLNLSFAETAITLALLMLTRWYNYYVTMAGNDAAAISLYSQHQIANLSGKLWLTMRRLLAQKHYYSNDVEQDLIKISKCFDNVVRISIDSEHWFLRLANEGNTWANQIFAILHDKSLNEIE